jgi:hypothetical protein
VPGHQRGGSLVGLAFQFMGRILESSCVDNRDNGFTLLFRLQPGGQRFALGFYVMPVAGDLVVDVCDTGLNIVVAFFQFFEIVGGRLILGHQVVAPFFGAHKLGVGRIDRSLIGRHFLLPLRFHHLGIDPVLLEGRESFAILNFGADDFHQPVFGVRIQRHPFAFNRDCANLGGEHQHNKEKHRFNRGLHSGTSVKNVQPKYR